MILAHSFSHSVALCLSICTLYSFSSFHLLKFGNYYSNVEDTIEDWFEDFGEMESEYTGAQQIFHILDEFITTILLSLALLELDSVHPFLNELYLRMIS